MLALCCTFSKLPHSAKNLFLIYEDLIQILLILLLLFVEDSQVEYLLCGAPSCCETSLLFCNDLQHDSDWMADNADDSIVLHTRKFPFLGRMKPGI